MADYANPEALVDTDWLEQHLNDDSTSRSSRSTRTRPRTRRATSRTRSRSTGRPSCTTCLAVSSSRPSSSRKLLGEQGHLERPDDRPLQRQQQLVRRLRLLALQVPRRREREAAQRWPQEVGAREPAADSGRAQPSGRDVRDRGRAARAPDLPRRGHRARARRRQAHGSTSVRPRSSAASCWPRRTFPRSRRRSRATSPAPRTSPGRRR